MMYWRILTSMLAVSEAAFLNQIQVEEFGQAVCHLSLSPHVAADGAPLPGDTDTCRNMMLLNNLQKSLVTKTLGRLLRRLEFSSSHNEVKLSLQHVLGHLFFHKVHFKATIKSVLLKTF